VGEGPTAKERRGGKLFLKSYLSKSKKQHGEEGVQINGNAHVRGHAIRKTGKVTRGGKRGSFMERGKKARGNIEVP